MSSISPDITKIITDGMITYSSNYRDMWQPSVELECYEWLRLAYPNIFAEFMAVYDVSK